MTIRASDLLARLQLEDPGFADAVEEIEEAHRLATNVLRLRAKMNISQAHLAAKAGVRQPRIAEIESGEANPTLNTIKKIANALGVTAGELLAEPAPQDDGVILAHGSLRVGHMEQPVEFRLDDYRELRKIIDPHHVTNSLLGLRA